MKNIAILTCLKATEVCSGASCFKALNDREKFFSPYKDEQVNVKSFFHCNGCSCEYENDKQYLEKMNRVFSLGIDFVHVGVCTLSREKEECSVITKMIETLENNNISVVRGTH